MEPNARPHPPDPIEDALRTFPQATPPPGLAPAVMARIRRLAPAPRFRLAWLDYALAFFMAGMGGVAVTLWRSVPVTAAQIAESRLGLLIVRLGPGALIAILLSGLVFALVALTAAAWLGVSLSLTPRRLR